MYHVRKSINQQRFHASFVAQKRYNRLLRFATNYAMFTIYTQTHTHPERITALQSICADSDGVW
jgi:hypothetical protein